ncbi:hypothetical protein BaRGS_00038826 [Batillaria attramentaria]|uniref:MULE transposase domain-containing protein n=1 Tax=Batillaria attramentaria TaxID=370345 RepID=A0ABD0J5V1_9CAEN
MIFIDSTHKTTQYDFQLITVLVLDDYREAVPVAWAISNKEDQETLTVFFDSVKAACGKDIATDIFMSDLAQNFWCFTFSKPAKRLYCSWHVDQAWRRQISMLIGSQDAQCTTYLYLKSLETMTDEAEFRQNLQQVLDYLNEVSQPFLNYFLETFVTGDKLCLWAGWSRIGSLANTNLYMFAEAFHRVLKDVYFGRRQNRRVDHLLHILLKLRQGQGSRGMDKRRERKN